MRYQLEGLRQKTAKLRFNGVPNRPTVCRGEVVITWMPGMVILVTQRDLLEIKVIALREVSLFHSRILDIFG